MSKSSYYSTDNYISWVSSMQTTNGLISKSINSFKSLKSYIMLSNLSMSLPCLNKSSDFHRLRAVNKSSIFATTGSVISLIWFVICRWISTKISLDCYEKKIIWSIYSWSIEVLYNNLFSISPNWCYFANLEKSTFKRSESF